MRNQNHGALKGTPCAVGANRLAVFFTQVGYTPSIAVRTEHHAVALCDVDDTVLSLDGHPTQLDVLRVG